MFVFVCFCILLSSNVQTWGVLVKLLSAYHFLTLGIHFQAWHLCSYSNISSFVDHFGEGWEWSNLSFISRVSLIRCKPESLENCTLKHHCFKEMKKEKWTDLSYSPPSPHMLQCKLEYTIGLTVYSVVLFSRTYLDSDCRNFKTFVFLDLFIDQSDWSEHHHTTQSSKLNFFLYRASTMLKSQYSIGRFGINCHQSFENCSILTSSVRKKNKSP